MIGTWSRSLIRLRYVEAGHAGQHEVEHYDVRMEGAELFQPLFTCSGGENVMPLIAQGQLNGLTDIWVIFDK